VNRGLRKSAFIVTGLVASFSLFLVVEHIRGRVSLSRYKANLVASGVNLAPRGFHAASRDPTNGIQLVSDGIRNLTAGRLLPNDIHPPMVLLPSGHAVAGYLEETWESQTLSNAWDQVAQDVEKNRGALGQIMAGLGQPVIESDIDFRQGPKLEIPLLKSLKPLARWLAAAAELELSKRNTAAAAPFYEAEIRLPHLVAAQNMVISELVRTLLASIARGATWEALQSPAWHDNDLARLQNAWEMQSFSVEMLRSLEAEFRDVDPGFAMFRASNDDAFMMLFGMETYFPIDQADWPVWEKCVRHFPYGEQIALFVKRQIYCRIWRFAWLDQHECYYLNAALRLAKALRSANAARSYAPARREVEALESAQENRNFYNRLRFPSSSSPLKMSRVIEKAMRAETERSIDICALAIQRFFLREGRFPDSLQSLVPDYVKSVPIDYMDGNPIRYRLQAEAGFILYSVGDDGRDDGGDPSLATGRVNEKSVWDRRDFVWPAAATAEELKVYRAHVH